MNILKKLKIEDCNRQLMDEMEDLRDELEDLSIYQSDFKEKLEEIKEDVTDMQWTYQDEEDIYMLADHLLGKISMAEIHIEEREM